MKIADKIFDQAFRLYRIIGRELIAHSNKPRPSSDPYITGDGFREMADYVYDALDQTLDTKAVAEGQIIFVGDSLIEKFVSKVHPHLPHKYVLVTHNGDAKITKKLFDLVADKVIRWYGINVEHNDPRITPIPLGIENKHYYVCGIPAVFNFVKRRKPPKQNRIFYGFTVQNNPQERGPALEIIKSHPDSQTLSSWRGFLPYLLELNKYRLVLSPPGSSEEGHRTWDTMYIGGVPIVKSSLTTEYFKSVGVPLLVLSDWKELNALNSKNISQIHESIIAEGRPETLNLKYWVNKIRTRSS